MITRYPAAPRVEDARDRLVAMNRPVPEPTPAAMAESEAEEQSRQTIQFTDRTLGLIRHGPTVVEAVHVGEPSLDDPKRTLAPTSPRKTSHVQRGRERGQARSRGEDQSPPRAPTSPAQRSALDGAADGGAGGQHGRGVSIVGAPNPAAADPNAVVKPVGPTNTAAPAAEAPAAAPDQINDIKPGTAPATTTATADTKKKKAPKADLSDESSSKKKKKKGLGS